MELLKNLAILLPFSVTSGVNFYATILVLSLSTKFEIIKDIPEFLEPFNSWVIIIVSGVCFLLEFFADKIQFIDNLWDAINTFIKPIGAGLFALMLLVDAPKEVAIIAALLVGGISFITHSTKAGGKLILNFFSPPENISNAAVSFAGEASVIALTLLTLISPWIAAGISIIILIFIIIYGPRLYRWGFFTAKALVSRILKFFGIKKRTNDTLPEKIQELLQDKTPKSVIHCKATHLKSANEKNGYLLNFNDEIIFYYRSFFKYRSWKINIKDIIRSEVKSGFFFDTLYIYFEVNGNEEMTAFVFLPNKNILFKKFSEQIGATIAPHL